MKRCWLTPILTSCASAPHRECTLITPLAAYLDPTSASTPPPIDLEPVAAPVPDSVQLAATKIGKSVNTNVVINSVGVKPLLLGGVKVTGPAAADFSVAASTCTGRSLAKGTSCTITVRFKPKAAGGRTAELEVADNTVEGAETIDLAGTGA